MDVLRNTAGRSVPVVVLTGQKFSQDAVTAMHLGANHFIQKPVEADYLWDLVLGLMKDAGSRLSEAWVSQNPAAQNFFRTLQQASQVREPVLLFGETGVGKKLAARLLHELTHKDQEEFHIFRTTGLDGREASERLFGGLEDSSHPFGAYYKAFGGTLFVEEIAEMPLDTQGQLLNVLERSDQVRTTETDAAFAPPRLI